MRLSKGNVVLAEAQALFEVVLFGPIYIPLNWNPPPPSPLSWSFFSLYSRCMFPCIVGDGEGAIVDSKRARYSSYLLLHAFSVTWYQISPTDGSVFRGMIKTQKRFKTARLIEGAGDWTRVPITPATTCPNFYLIMGIISYTQINV